VAENVGEHFVVGRQLVVEPDVPHRQTEVLEQ